MRVEAPVFELFREVPPIDRALVASRQNSQELAGRSRALRAEILGGKPSFSITESIFCLRGLGYRLLGYQPREETAEEIFPSLAGSAIHWDLLRRLRPFGQIEVPLTIELPEVVLSGRADFVCRHSSGVLLVGEIKTTSGEGLRMITREGLPPWLSKIPGIYCPRPEDKLQLILYMMALSRSEERSIIGKIIYLTRDEGARKDCFVPFDAVARQEAEVFLEKVGAAAKAIKEGNLPEASIDSRSAEFKCGQRCGFGDRCSEGQEYLARRIRRERKRMPAWLRRKAEAEQELFVQQMASQMASQPELFDTSDLERRPLSRRSEQSRKSEPPLCGECGLPMVGETLTKKGRQVTEYACPYH